MPEIRDLDKLVPEDIVFKYRGKEYTLPGDIDVDSTFELLALFQRVPKAETGTTAVQHKLNLDIRAALLRLFQQRQPDLEALPFGMLALGHVLSEVLQILGVVVMNEPDPTPRPAKKTTKKAPARRSPSRSSTGSSSS